MNPFKPALARTCSDSLTRACLATGLGEGHAIERIWEFEIRKFENENA
jgi:hypothetical protein